MSSALAPKATRQEWLGLSILVLPGLVYATDVTALDVALPTISATLQPSSTQLLWLVDIYGFLLASFLVTMGTLGDRIGRRKLLLFGAAGFSLISCAAATATSVNVLIVLRALLGISAATLAPSTMSILRNMFHDDEERQLAIGVWIATISGGAILGALMGGLVLQYVSWNFVFLIPVAPMLVVLLLGPSLLPEFRNADSGRLDLPSVLMSLFCLLPFIQALKLTAANGLGAWPLSLVVVGLLVGIAFMRRQSQLAHPLVDLSLFRHPQFTPAIAAYGLACFAMFGQYVLIAQYLQLVMGLSPWGAGLATVPCALASAVGSLTAPALVSRSDTRSVLIGGLITAIAGTLAFAAGIGHVGLIGTLASVVLFSLGLAFVFAPAYEMIVTSSPPERSGAAAAIAETVSELGGSLGIALLGSLSTAIYRRTLFASLPPGLPEGAAQKAAATIGGASATAGTLAPVIGEALLTSARAAFSTALQFASLAAAVTIAVACYVVVRAWRQTELIASTATPASTPARIP